MLRCSPAAAAALLTVTLAACSGAGDAPKDVAVRGRVVSEYYGSPVAAAVWIGGVQQATGAGGAFTFDRVDTPYDLVVVAQGQAFVFEGVTTRDPVVPLPMSDTVQTATVSGTFSGGTYPETTDSGLQTRLSFGSPQALRDQWSTTNTDGTFTESFSWPGPETSVTGVLRALQWRRDAQSKPTQYLGFGTKTVTLTAGAPLAGVEVPLAPVVQNGRLQGEFAFLPGWDLLVATFHVYWPDLGELSLGAPSTQAFDFATPALDGARVVIHGLAVDPASDASSNCDWANLGTTATGLSLQLPAPPAPGTPADLAAGVGYGTTFSWFDGRAGVKVLRISPVQTNQGIPPITVYTTRSSVRVPDLRAMSIALSPSVPYTWTISGWSEASVDALLVPPIHGPVDECQTQAASRTFTTSATP